jgi:integrase/recombinase XerD
MNARKQRLSRSGIRYILQKYLVKARNKRSSLNRIVSPHTLRHTKGIHLWQSGISLDMIRDFLRHVDVKTTLSAHNSVRWSEPMRAQAKQTILWILS